MIGWIWIVILLLAPALLSLLPQAPSPIVSKEERVVIA
jgi:hypothetical protein